MDLIFFFFICMHNTLFVGHGLTAWGQFCKPD